MALTKEEKIAIFIVVLIVIGIAIFLIYYFFFRKKENNTIKCSQNSDCTNSNDYCNVSGQCLPGCRTDSQCPANNKCLSGVCTSNTTCSTGNDCPIDYTCTNNICVPPQACGSTGPIGPTGPGGSCPSNQTCGADGYCKSQCGNYPYCPLGTQCSNSNCVPLACSLTNPCPDPSNQECVAGYCNNNCSSQNFCPSNTVCRQGECYPIGCTGNSNCAPGLYCINGTCGAQTCTNTNQCPAGINCFNNQCNPTTCDTTMPYPCGYGPGGSEWMTCTPVANGATGVTGTNGVCTGTPPQTNITIDDTYGNSIITTSRGQPNIDIISADLAKPTIFQYDPVAHTIYATVTQDFELQGYLNIGPVDANGVYSVFIDGKPPGNPASSAIGWYISALGQQGAVPDPYLNGGIRWIGGSGIGPNSGCLTYGPALTNGTLGVVPSIDAGLSYQCFTSNPSQYNPSFRISMLS